MVNINSWNKLPKDLQAVLNGAMQEVEKEAYDHFGKLISQDREKIKKKGVKEIKFTGKDGEAWLHTAYDSGWKNVVKKEPQLGQQLHELMTK